LGVSAVEIKSLRELALWIVRLRFRLQKATLKNRLIFSGKKVLRPRQKNQAVHYGGKIGVLVEVNCETDFVARNPEFQTLVKDLSMQVAGSNPAPLYVRKEEVPEEIIEHERAIFKAQAMESKKPEAVIEKIAEGKINKFLKSICLMEQPFLKNPDITVSDLVAQTISKVGENIQVRRFVRFQLGEGEA